MSYDHRRERNVFCKKQPIHLNHTPRALLEKNRPRTLADLGFITPRIRAFSSSRPISFDLGIGWNSFYGGSKLDWRFLSSIKKELAI